MEPHSTVTRRRLLEATGGAIGIAGIGTSSVGAQEAHTVFNVGYRAASGRQAALTAATDVEREFAFDALTIEIPEQAAQGLRQRPDVRYVEENGRMETFEQTTPWGVDQVGATIAHDADETGGEGSIAIIDTGINATHEDLTANLGDGVAFADCLGGCDEAWDDDHGHGTHVAGTAGAVDNELGVIGVAPDATLHAVKVLDGDGGGTFSDIAAGIEWTADQGHNVGNLSLGASSGSEAVRDACQYAEERGVLLIAAAGNTGSCTDCVGFPAAYEECLAVSATDEDDELAHFSSIGPEIELAAPGVQVLSTTPNDDYDQFSGTSMAAPHVAGAAAIAMSEGLDHGETRNRLQETAEDIGLEKEEQGYGLVDVSAAINPSDDVITITGATSETAHYTVSFDGNVEKSTDYRGTINDYDEINGAVAAGRTTAEPDSYAFDGEITGLTADAPVEVLLNGIEVDPAMFGEPDRTILTITGGNSTSNYTFSIDGEVEKTTAFDATINPYDEITSTDGHDTIVTGRTTAEPDSFVFSGEITSLSVSTPANISINSVEVNPGQFDNTIITITGATSETAHYGLKFIGDVEKSTEYGGTINEYDEIHDSSVTGRTTNEPDSFRFEGEITGFTADAPVDVEFNGQLTGPWM